MIKISVVVTTYKRLSYLVECIDSILSQSYPPFEIIVISDGFDCEVDSLVKIKNASNINLVYNFTESHIGRPAPLRNLGIQISKGDYIAFCDDDDIWMLHKLEYQVQAMLKVNASLSITNSNLILNDGKIIKEKVFFYQNETLDFQVFLLKSNIILSSVLAKKVCFNNIKFKEEELYKGWEDFRLWVDLYLNIPNLIIIVLDQSLVSYRISKDSIRKSNAKNKFISIKKDISASLKQHKYYWYNILFVFIMNLKIIAENFRVRKYLSRVKT